MFSQDLHAEDKLLLLLALDILDMPITNLYINDLLLQPGYMNYFNIQTALSQLVEAGFVDRIPDSDGIPMYSINEKGREAFREFSYLLPDGLATKYEDHITKNKNQVKKMVEVNASVFTVGKDDYFVRCFVRDKGTYVIDLKLPAASREDAYEICRTWRESSSEIYTEIVKILHRK